jgi:signal transduction histidine kinase
MTTTPIGTRRARVHLLTDDPALEQLVRELLATTLPSTLVDATTPAEAPLVPADAAIIDHTVRALPAFIVAQELRARGFGGGIVIIAAAGDKAEERLLTVAPAREVSRSEIASGLPHALAAVVSRPAADGELTAVERDLRRTQQLIAMGEVTSRIQHTLNNPLTALLAEAQLLEMEPLDPDQLASVRRIIELCRRVVTMVRGLDTGPRVAG